MPLMLGDAASRIGIRTWQLQRLYARGLLDAPARCGRYRLVDEADFPAIREAAIQAGYLKVVPAGRSAVPA